MGNRASVLLIDKKCGLTSFQSLGAIKRKTGGKVGHCGTLDKFAEGLMIVLTGPLTKLNGLFSGLDKGYTATIRFGEETDTLDPEGEVVATAPVPQLSCIKQAIQEHFSGSILQAPPQYSAIHVNGRRAYALAREGKQVEMKQRPVYIRSFEILSWDGKDLSCHLEVSKGTYIRSIARDLALSCGSRGHLVALRRTSIGPYTVDEAVAGDDDEGISRLASQRDSLLLRLKGVVSCTIPDKAFLSLMSSGKRPDKSELTVDCTSACDFRYGLLYTSDGLLKAVIEFDAGGNCTKVIARIPQEN
ncbi:MAG: tRNA pseudouridine(55) synthase TruB [Spirochaetia bacterium]|jgi:tRNA pseudouridine55 synthase|nr:tRNA pseudouridine(55) synthase TruB [Spirochaetia bacterium]